MVITPTVLLSTEYTAYGGSPGDNHAVRPLCALDPTLWYTLSNRGEYEQVKSIVIRDRQRAEETLRNDNDLWARIDVHFMRIFQLDGHCITGTQLFGHTNPSQYAASNGMSSL